jgi:hypothetical protein
MWAWAIFVALFLLLLEEAWVYPSPLGTQERFEGSKGLLAQGERMPQRSRDDDSYFHQAEFSHLQDARYADRKLSLAERNEHLVPLLQTFSTVMQDIGIDAFIMHDTLLGWHWERRIVHPNSSPKMMVSEQSLYFLAAYHNMSVHTFRIPSLNASKEYVLEINPHYQDGRVGTANSVDARWIEMETGLFVEITTLRHNRDAEILGIKGAMMVKDGRHYEHSDVYPLKDAVFLGVGVKVPSAYLKILIDEYGVEIVTRERSRVQNRVVMQTFEVDASQ